MRTLTIDKADTVKEIVRTASKTVSPDGGRVFDLLKEPKPHFSKSFVGSPYLRLSLGEYRVIYRFDDSRVTVVAFGKRNDGEVYRVLNRKE